MNMEKLVKLRYWSDIVFGFSASAGILAMLGYLAWRML